MRRGEMARRFRVAVAATAALAMGIAGCGSPSSKSGSSGGNNQGAGQITTAENAIDASAKGPAKDVQGLVEKLKTQKGIVIDQKVVAGATHFFDNKIEALMQSVQAYLDKRLKPAENSAA